MKKIKFVDLNAQYKKYKREIDISIKTCVENSDFINGDSVREFEKNLKIN